MTGRLVSPCLPPSPASLPVILLGDNSIPMTPQDDVPEWDYGAGKGQQQKQQLLGSSIRGYLNLIQSKVSEVNNRAAERGSVASWLQQRVMPLLHSHLKLLNQLSFCSYIILCYRLSPPNSWRRKTAKEEE